MHSIPNILPNWSGNSSSARIGAAAAADVKKSGKRLEELEELRRSMGTTTLLSWHASGASDCSISGNCIGITVSPTMCSVQNGGHSCLQALA